MLSYLIVCRTVTDCRSPAITRTFRSKGLDLNVGDLFPGGDEDSRYLELKQQYGRCFPELGHKLVLRLAKIFHQNKDFCR